MKKVVLLGDSIRLIGYGTIVPKMLGEEYEVFQPEDNCRWAKYTERMLFDYKNYLKDADQSIKSMSKTRQCFLYNNRY